MARMPGAAWAGPHHDNGVMRSAGPNVLIFHTIVGHDPAHAAHFSVGGYGELTQSRDTAYQSAASLEANPRSIAVETEDTGLPFPAWSGGHNVPAWTDAQCEVNAQIAAWCYHTHGIPLVLATDSRTPSAGVAYHRMGIDGNFAAEGYAYPGRVPGGEHWSTSTGKVCPGDRRITQLIQVVISRARILAGIDKLPVAPTTPPVNEEDMFVSCFEINSSPGHTGTRSGILSGGRLIDITDDQTARNSAQTALNAKLAVEVRVSAATWDRWESEAMA